MSKSEGRRIMEGVSPNCPVQAVVEDNGRNVYFYLFGQARFGERFMRSCWVRNYEDAPDDLDVDGMKNGKAPSMPANSCNHPQGGESLQEENLEIVWFEEGDGAALLENGEIISVIPGWGDEACPGFSRDCVQETTIAWPLKEDNVLIERVNGAKEFWNGFDDTRWEEYRDGVIDALENTIGEQENYYAIDGGYWPPKGIVTAEKGDYTYITTVGVGIIPQPKVENHFENPEDHRRIELGLIVETDILERDSQSILGYLSGQTSLPWECLSFLGHGHTVPADVFKAYGTRFPYVVLVDQEKELPLPDFRGDKVKVLWMVPLTENEWKSVKEDGVEATFKDCGSGEDLIKFNGEEIEYR